MIHSEIFYRDTLKLTQKKGFLDEHENSDDMMNRENELHAISAGMVSSLLLIQ